MSKKVLIVGDTPRWLEAVKNILPGDSDVHVATDYVGALRILFQEEHHFDLHIVGNKLPDFQDGLKILTEVRGDGRDEPFVIFSDHVDETTTREAVKLKATTITRRNGLSHLQAVITRCQ